MVRGKAGPRSAMMGGILHEVVVALYAVNTAALARVTPPTARAGALARRTRVPTHMHACTILP